MKLISMADYVLESIGKFNTYESEENLNAIINYANFLKQPLKLGMFVPCDENENVLKEPKGWKAFVQTNGWKSLHPDALERCTIFAQAKERVIFDGFEFINDELINNGILFWVGKFDGNEIIENRMPSNLILTDYAIKQLNI